MTERINITLNPSASADLGKYNDSLTILRAGFYPAERNHCIFRGFTGNQRPFDIPYEYNPEMHCDVLDEAIIIYCVDGEGFFATKAERHEIKKGSLIFCDRNTVHAYGANPDNPWTIYWIHFSGGFSFQFSQSMQLSKNGFCIRNIGCGFEYIRTFRRVCGLLDSPADKLRISTANSHFKTFLCEMMLSVQACTDITDKSNETMNDVIRFMRKHIDGSLTLARLAEHADLSKYYLSHKFKRTTGYSPIQYFNQLKIQKACDLLENGNMSIKEISMILGFSTSYYFSNMFKEHMGFSPSHYRELSKTKY